MPRTPRILKEYATFKADTNMSNSFSAKQFFKVCQQIRSGSLRVTTPSGNIHQFGEGVPNAEIVIRDWSIVTIIAERGDIGLGETFVRGLWDTPDLEAFLTLLLENEDVSIPMSSGSRLQQLIFRFTNSILRRNNRAGSLKNIRNHYDVGNSFYELWLDRSMTYSSALYKSANDSLESAQSNKYSRLLSLLPSGADNLLEIGCGWGGFAEQAAEAGRSVTGVTVSRAQLEYAQKRLGNNADIQLRDYRDINGVFDSIVSVEMVEAVGERYWPDYFRAIKRSLAGGGTAALQAIIVEDHSFERYRNQSDFIRHYTFPGGMLLAPKSIQSCAEQCGLIVNNFHRFGQDYARTLREWLNQFNHAESNIRLLGHDDEFIRSWRYYFEFCAAGFAHGKHINVAQIALSHK